MIYNEGKCNADFDIEGLGRLLQLNPAHTEAEFS